MKTNEIIKYTNKPNLYEPGNAIIWTYPYISKQLLQIHLNEHIDLGRRKPETIKNIIDWILPHTNLI